MFTTSKSPRFSSESYVSVSNFHVQLDETVAHDRSRMAPEGCSQYHFKRRKGRIISFNHDSQHDDNSRYEPDLNYRICIKNPGNCQVSIFLILNE